jgi:hypothetical protein
MKNGVGKSDRSKINIEDQHFDVVIIGSNLPALTSASAIIATSLSSLSSLCVYQAEGMAFIT